MSTREGSVPNGNDDRNETSPPEVGDTERGATPSGLDRQSLARDGEGEVTTLRTELAERVNQYRADATERRCFQRDPDNRQCVLGAGHADTHVFETEAGDFIETL